jgi:nucleotide-binding universal stress UspA family protein
MKKILVAFDGTHASAGALEFARRMNETEPILLIGVFIPQVDFSSGVLYAPMGNAGFIPFEERYDPVSAAAEISEFEEACIRHQIEFRVHNDHSDQAIQELKKETRFADLLILGSEKFYSNLGTDFPNEYLKLILHDAECPVLLVPEKYNFPENNILSYDGSDDAVFAIKSFSCLFPQLCGNKTTLVYATKHQQAALPDEEYIKELAARHFSDLTLQVLDVDPKRYFETFIADFKNPILISGAFARNTISLIFKNSFITGAFNDHRIPVFIAHR